MLMKISDNLILFIKTASNIKLTLQNFQAFPGALTNKK